MNKAPSKNKIRKEIIKRLVEGENNSMTEKKKKQPVKRARSGLERLNKTRDDFESKLEDFSKSKIKRNSESLDIPEESKELIRLAFKQELPKMIRDGTIDVKSLLGNNGGVNNPIGINNEVIKMMDILTQSNNGGNNQLTQLKQMIELMQLLNPQQQQSQPKGNDNMLLAYILKQKESNNNNLLPFMSQMMQMNEQYNNARLETIMSRMGSGHSPEDPQEKLMKNLNFFRELTGDSRNRTKDEMIYDLKRQELNLKEQARLDTLNREERQTERDDKKSERILDIGGVVLDKIVGNGLGSLVNDLMKVKTKKKKRRGRDTESDQFDPSLLDDL